MAMMVVVKKSCRVNGVSMRYKVIEIKVLAWWLWYLYINVYYMFRYRCVMHLEKNGNKWL